MFHLTRKLETYNTSYVKIYNFCFQIVEYVSLYKFKKAQSKVVEIVSTELA